MFGLGRSDHNQRAAVDKLKSAMVPLRGRYLYRLRRNGAAVLLTEKQRDELLLYYGELVNHSMWIMMIVLLAGAMLLITASMVWHFEMHFWAVMILIAIAIAPMFAINRQMRAKVQEFGTLPSVPAQEVETLSRKRLKNMSWSALFAPLGGLVYLRMRPHLPPQNADDWTEIALLAALVTVFAWGALIKLRADRGGPI